MNVGSDGSELNIEPHILAQGYVGRAKRLRGGLNSDADQLLLPPATGNERDYQQDSSDTRKP